MRKNKRWIGFLLVSLGAFFWGIGGTTAQQLFQQSNIDVTWLVCVRLVISGILLLLLQVIFKDRHQIIHIWKQKFTAVRLIIFSFIGMLAVQYTYMIAIDYGNAAIATLLQYLAPVMILMFFVVVKRAPLTKMDWTTLILACSGTFLLITNGSLLQLSVPLPAVVWGVLSGATLAFYTLYAIPLLKQFDSLVVVGWAMVIAGMSLLFFVKPWKIDISSWTITTYFQLIFVIIFGTMLAFWFYIESLQTLSAKETSLLGNIEPLTAVLATVIWLQVPFGSFQWLGAALIVFMMILLALKKKEEVSQPLES